MRIDSMDASFKPTVNVETAKIKQEAPVKPTYVPPEHNREVTSVATKENYTKLTEEKINEDFLQSSIDRVNHTFEMQRRSVRFKIHERTNEVMVKIIDADTEEVIREIPPEKLLDMFANMLELAGLIVDERR